MILLNAILVGGVAAVAVPLAVHVLHKRRITQMDWGAMRFLIDMLARSKRKIRLEELLLLAIRMGIVACLAFALSRPAWQSSADIAVVTRPAERVSAVVVIDTSASSGYGRDEPHLVHMKALAQAYMDTLREGDEVSLITIDSIAAPAADPNYDLASVRNLIDQLEPSTRHSDIPALMDAALQQLNRHLNPAAEVVLITDGLQQGWRADSRALWTDIQDRFTHGDEDQLGTLQRPRLVLMQPEEAAEMERTNVAVTDLRMVQTAVFHNTEAHIVAELQRTGEAPSDEIIAVLSVGDRVVAREPVTFSESPLVEVSFTHRFEDPGQHGLRVELLGTRDGFSQDDQRAISLRVVEQIPVLLVEGDPGKGRSGSLGLVSLALAPHGNEEQDRVAITRIPAEEIVGQDLSSYRVVIIGDVEVLSGASLASLERFVSGGGGLLMTLGDQSRPDLMNRLWARAGDGLLPVALGDLQESATEQGEAPALAGLGHPALASFSGTTAEAWREFDIQRWYAVDSSAVPAEQLQVLLRMQNGDPLLIERRRGLGRVMLFTTGLDSTWSDVAVRRSFVPLMHGIVGHLGSILQPPINLAVGDRLVHAVGSAEEDAVLHGPDESLMDMEPGTWQGRRTLSAGPLVTPGLYTVGSTEDAPVYAVALKAAESDFAAFDPAVAELALARVSGRVEADSPDAVAELFGDAERGRSELFIWLVLAAICLFVIEGWYTHRNARLGGQQTGAGNG